MFLYLRIGLLTCGLYLGTLLVIEATKIALARLWGAWGISYSSQRFWYWSDIIFYGLIWFVSFSLARHFIWRTLHFPTGKGWHFGG